MHRFRVFRETKSGYRIRAKWRTIIYQLKPVKRRFFGKSRASHYAYINREGKYKRDDIEQIESGNLPSWAVDAQHFWKAADKYERANGRIYTELEISLPRELKPRTKTRASSTICRKDFKQKLYVFLCDSYTFSK